MINRIPKNIRWAVATFLAVGIAVYGLLLFSGNDEVNMYAEERGIDSFARLILNGYLGQFFKYKYVGTLVWVALPFFIAHLLKVRNQSRTVKGFTLLYVLSILLIAVQGYYNTRYQLSLFPITVSFLALKLFEYFEKKSVKPSIVIIVICIGILTVFNYSVFAVERFVKNRNQEADTAVLDGAVAELSIRDRLNVVFEAVNEKLGNTLPALLEHDGIEGDRRHIYYQIDSLPIEQKILVNNQPGIFYYTQKPGVMYWCRKDLISDQRGRYSLLENRSNQEVRDYLIDSLNCKYIFSTFHYNEYNPRFVEFIAERCDTLLQEGDFVLYEIR